MHVHVKMHHRIVFIALVALLSHVSESESLVRPFKSIKAPKGKIRRRVIDLLYTLVYIKAHVWKFFLKIAFSCLYRDYFSV